MLDGDGTPVPSAKVLVAGMGRTTTNRKGYAKFYLPGPDHYAVVVTSKGIEEVLYEEALAPGKTYVYRPDPEVAAGRYFILATAGTEKR